MQQRHKRHALTKIILGWLKETYPEYRCVVEINHIPGVLHVHCDSVDVPLVSNDRTLYPSDPKFFSKLKPLITRRLRHRARCITKDRPYCFHF